MNRGEKEKRRKIISDPQWLSQHIVRVCGTPPPPKQRPPLTYAISKGVVNDATLGSASQTTKRLRKGIRSSRT